MQIRNTNSDALAQSRASEASSASQVRGVQGRGSGVGSSGSTSDRVEVSDLAERVTRVVEHDATARSQKLASLENAYMSGQYRVDPAALGGAILQAATRMPGEG